MPQTNTTLLRVVSETKSVASQWCLLCPRPLASFFSLNAAGDEWPLLRILNIHASHTELDILEDHVARAGPGPSPGCCARTEVLRL